MRGCRYTFKVLHPFMYMITLTHVHACGSAVPSASSVESEPGVFYHACVYVSKFVFIHMIFTHTHIHT